MQEIACITLLALTGGAVLSDLRNGTVPNVIILTGLVLAGTGSVIGKGPPGPAGALAGACIPLALTGWLHLFHMIGAGDIKLLCMAGAFAGPAGAVQIIFYSFLSGGAIAFALLLHRGTLHSRFHYLNSYMRDLLDGIRSGEIQRGKHLPSYLDGVTADGRFCFSVPILCGVILSFLR